MPSPLEKIKPEVRAIKAYSLAPLKAPIKINQNENPHDLPGEIKAGGIQTSRTAAVVPLSDIRSARAAREACSTCRMDP
jgi:hypothetical protein